MSIILDPTAELNPIPRKLTPLGSGLPASLALVDISKPKGVVFLDRLEQRIQARYPQLEIRRYVKPAFAKPAPEDLRRQIAKSHECVILALAD